MLTVFRLAHERAPDRIRGGGCDPRIRTGRFTWKEACARQRPRCWYFHRGFGLLARDASGRDLVSGGENRYGVGGCHREIQGLR
jgi:hypothetical protein